MRAVRATLLAFLLAVCCPVGLVACGDDGSGSISSSGGAAQAEQAPGGLSAEAKAQSEEAREQYERMRRAEAPSAEEERAEQVAADFYEILAADEAGDQPDRTAIDSAAFCELMSARARAQTIHYAKISSGTARKWDCESAVALLVLRAKRAGGGELERAEVIGVSAEGDRATASVRFGDGAITSLPLVKEGGEWKLAATPTSTTGP